MDEKVIRLKALVDARNLEDGDCEGLCNGAVVELPDGTKWRRAEPESTAHHEAVREQEFKRKNDGTSIEEAGDAQLKAIENGLPEPWFDWSTDPDYHDVFERIDGAGSYCLSCGTAWS